LPGALAVVTQVVADAGANIHQVNHQRAFTSLPAQEVEIDLVLQTRGHEHVNEILAALKGHAIKAHRAEH
jgi:threonine dehydratase